MEAELAYALAGFDVVIVPGLDGSPPVHWQSRWETVLRARGVNVHRAVQHDWARPHYPDWKHGLLRTMRHAARPVIMVAHSLGAVLVARLAQDQELAGVAGAFLVAPADIDHHDGPDVARITGFSPLPTAPLFFPAMLVASRNDEWLGVDRAHALARQWNATVVDAGSLGHIGNTSNVGPWHAGMAALAGFARTLPRR
ncbi:alpha/beta hydrolase [Komagataeibacter sp. FNDCF1]|uniref:RBBP9/YdeN family alpha/beta hydrolase n=1 Tax=Komagataeibacter sp. FNDCF1 TaxID=2878681 RepID=UPI001E34D17C|nr:alpha/beta fold hydrolase [Komagataeibacter sp. FNDCF1]MCE2563704.1 alpha/beta hydrolase [Komagataeibacter sp. FNDCF1]